MVEFELAREFGYYIVHLYLPGILLVFVSWISFWLDPSSVPGRVTLGVTTLLTMATQASSVSAHLPPVSYAKAIDIWIGMCTSYLFGSLIEFAIVTFLYDKQMRQKFAIVTFLYDKQMRQNKNILEELKSKKNLNVVINKPWAMRRVIYHIEKDAKLVDNFSRIAFPTTFLISNLIYWIYYTQEWFH
uniref:Neurotransmitter-gated ion-channel transmembrane domain-containing protein n=1 Tax=Acrobeloides nanus TaxID=290746 RepID=A0A914D290_9BILA